MIFLRSKDGSKEMCKATPKNGGRCLNTALFGGYCWVHYKLLLEKRKGDDENGKRG